MISRPLASFGIADAQFGALFMTGVWHLRGDCANTSGTILQA